MPRPRRCRRIASSPGFNYFKPAGVGLKHLKETLLTIDEYEAIRLKDSERLGQAECSERMHVSQPTFHRLLIMARQKIADSIVNGKAIRIETGIKGGFCICTNCGARIPKNEEENCKIDKCPECKSYLRGS
ncbi:MAG: DUF134 domain-containing protein [Nanoarchaeota archaeon]